MVTAIAIFALARTITPADRASWFGSAGALAPAIATAGAALAAVVIGGLDSYGRLKSLLKAQHERDEVRAKIDLTVGQPERGLQEKSIELHTQRLQIEVNGLRTRALVAFVPGLFLCFSALAGPYTAYTLAEAHNDWRFMLGGSTLAAVLLAAGTALLRHDNTLLEQIQRSQGEYLYFSRLKTGLDCASTLGEDKYQAGLKLVIAHLLAAPPSLTVAEAKSKDDDDEKSALAEAMDQLTKLIEKKKDD